MRAAGEDRPSGRAAPPGAAARARGGRRVEPVETKLAKTTRGATLILLYLYAELLAELPPQDTDFEEQDDAFAPGREKASPIAKVEATLASGSRARRRALLDRTASRGPYSRRWRRTRVRPG